MCAAAENNWRTWWPSRADAIAADIRARLTAAVAAWRLSALEPLPGGDVALVFGAATEGDDLRHADASEIVRTLGALCPRVHLPVAPGQFRQLGEGSEAQSWRGALAGTRELGELERLLIPTREDRLLHTDLHWLNALRGPDSWFVIDPNPHVGDPHADVFAFFDGPPLSAMPDGRRAAREHMRALTELYARAAGLDRDRVEAWIRIRALAIVGQSRTSASATDDRARAWSERLLRLADAVV